MKHWESVKLSDLAEKVGSGSTPKGGSNAYKASGIPLIRSMNIHFDSFRYEGLVYLDDKQAHELKNVEVKTKDVLLNITGASIGRVILAPKDLEGARVNQHVCIIRTLLALDSSFLCKYLSSPIIQKKIMAEEYGVTRQALTKQMILDFDIPLPPLNEQRRIVAKIEALSARSQRVKEALLDIPQLLDQFRQSVLAAAFRGDLTADWREQNADVEPAEVLLERIRAERRRSWEEAELEKMKAGGKTPKDDKWKEKYKETEPINDLKLLEIPEGWCWVTIGHIADCLDKMRVPVNKEERSKRPGNIPYYGANGQVDWIDDYIFDEPLVILVEDETFIGRTKPFCYKITGKSWVNNHAHVLRAIKPIDVDFLNYSLMFYPFVPLTCGTTGRRKLTQAALLSAPYALPPLEEQQQIVTRIKQYFNIADKIQQSLKSDFDLISQLDQSILAKAFRGELVPQDPNDEPASILLERIREERAKLQNKTAKKSTTKTSARRTKKTQPQEEESVQLELGLE